MLHYSKFSLFAFLVLLCAAVSGCTTSTKSLTTADPAQTEEIEKRSLRSPAYIVFYNGDTSVGYRVGVRTDSTEWHETDTAYDRSSGLADSVLEFRYISPTSDVKLISISTPDVLGDMLIGAGAGALLGAIIYEGAKHSNTEDQTLGDQLMNYIAVNIGFEGWTVGLGAFGAGFGIESGMKYRTEYVNENVNYANGEKWWK
jgi:hypothetical protein